MHGMTDKQKTARIQAVIRQAGDELRHQYPLLARQNLIGSVVMAGALAGMASMAVLYAKGLLAWWMVIPMVALFQSLIHELEHDLIHLMYFKDRPWAYHLMLLLCWLARPSTISPWVRRNLHLHHHKHSGTETDLEERGITNGESWGLKRLLMTGDNMLAVFLRPVSTYRMVRAYAKAQKPASRREELLLNLRQWMGYSPIGLMHYVAWHGFLAYHATAYVAAHLGVPLTLSPMAQQLVHTLDFVAVAWLLPSHLRTFCLHFVSSNIHYYGDVEDRNVMQQCQVVTAWWMTPFQLFCFNFGATHAIHHFMVRDPFYIRQLTATKAHQVMREMGVRFNDFGTFLRANRFQRADEPVAAAALERQPT